MLNSGESMYLICSYTTLIIEGEITSFNVVLLRFDFFLSFNNDLFEDYLTVL